LQAQFEQQQLEASAGFLASVSANALEMYIGNANASRESARQVINL